MGRRIVVFIAGAAVMFLSFNSCKKDKLLTDSSATLNFSEDTVKFDTVFVTTGSATQEFTVTNPYSQPINISSISLGVGATSFYRLNVNGTPGKSFTNIEIGAKDSIWIFVEVTVPDPNSPNTPFVISDSIVFNTNGHFQNVKLQARGQRAHFHSAPPNQGSLFLICNETWTNDLPHVVYGYAVVDSGCTLTISEGTNVYFHVRSGIFVLSGGKIKVNGTLQNQVTLQGDRLGVDFKDIPGQWDRIQLTNTTHSNIFNGTNEHGPGPMDNVFNYAVIKNGYVGIESDTFAVPHVPAVVLNNCILKNFASTALYGAGSNIQANNCVFANCAQYCTAMFYGGDYRFLQCTIANYWSQTDRTTPAVYMQNYYDVVRPLDSAYFGNCIIYGSNDNEIGLDSDVYVTGNNFNFVFDHTLIKIDPQTSTSNSYHFNNIFKNIDPLFKDVTNNDYSFDPNSTSVAFNTGSLQILTLNPSVLDSDIVGNPRPQGTGPDLGAYEVK